jgi:hypothetical protein
VLYVAPLCDDAEAAAAAASPRSPRPSIVGCAAGAGGEVVRAGVRGVPSTPLSVAFYRPNPLTIFLSYGHDGYTSVCRHVRAVLIARGHSVWFDENSLGVGTLWTTLLALFQ